MFLWKQKFIVYKLWNSTGDSVLLTAYCLLYFNYFHRLLPTAHFNCLMPAILLAIHSLLNASCLPDAYCLLLTAYCALLTAHCLLLRAYHPSNQHICV